MKNFINHSFSLSECEKELVKYDKLLKRKKPLKEREDILPFFRKNKNLAILIGYLNAEMTRRTELAFEYPFWGDFTCDLAIADPDKFSFCFIEFEDCGKNSVFKSVSKKSTKEYGARFEKGFSQIIDWFCRIDGHKNTGEIKKTFGADTISYIGVLIIGRSNDINPKNHERLKWRQTNLLIANTKIQYLTFDDLKHHFENTINNIKDMKKYK